MSPVVLANARMLGADRPRSCCATSTCRARRAGSFQLACTPSVGLAFVGAVVGEYLGSARGVGYLILQAEGTFDINTVFAGILVLTGVRAAARRGGRPHREASDEMAAADRRNRENLSRELR